MLEPLSQLLSAARMANEPGTAAAQPY
jgi:hypothetical protein